MPSLGLNEHPTNLCKSLGIPSQAPLLHSDEPINDRTAQATAVPCQVAHPRDIHVEPAPLHGQLLQRLLHRLPQPLRRAPPLQAQLEGRLTQRGEQGVPLRLERFPPRLGNT